MQYVTQPQPREERARTQPTVEVGDAPQSERERMLAQGYPDCDGLTLFLSGTKGGDDAEA